MTSFPSIVLIIIGGLILWWSVSYLGLLTDQKVDDGS